MSRKVKKKKSLASKITIITLYLTFIAIIGALFLFYDYIRRTAPDFDKRNLYMHQSTIILDKDGNQVVRLGTENRELISYNELPQVLIDAIVATEDARFFEHNGFDPIRFVTATYRHLLGEKGAGGASTLTMQISKNAFTSTETEGIKGIVRKFTDIYLSMFKIEKNYSKEEIFEIYVNNPYLGAGSYGVEMASQNYFGKSVRDLTLSEAALIAGLFNAPSMYDPYVNLYDATVRRDEVLTLMYKHGYISYEQLQDELSVDVFRLLTGKKTGLNEYQGFIDTVVSEVIEDTGNNPYEVSMVIHSTLDPFVQNAINDVMTNPNNFKDDVIQAGIAITSTENGSILGIGNGRKRTGALQYNYATMIRRQPGSSIKPFMVYGPYFEFNNGKPTDIVVDEPYKYSDGSPIKNAYGDHVGALTIKQALAQSRNIPALKIFQKVDKNKISDYVHSFGIDYGQHLYESASLGAFDGVSPLQMSAAYGALARGGYYIPPYSYTTIEYRDNNEKYEKSITKEKVCSDKTVKYINDILLYAVSSEKILGTLEIGKTEVAGKTGTTSVSGTTIKALDINEYSVNDSWACLYSSKYAASLWYGYDHVTSKYYMVNLDATLGRRRIMKKLSKIIFTDNSKLITSTK